ncbi:MAG: hypothetical protein EAZ08_09385 [Cytophagales bacterium]|nr:MAG: hypothetical protein EAZ08_09385 [Cytophagales bacterium]
MNRLVYHYLCFCLLLLCFQRVFAQDEMPIKGLTMNAEGKIVGNVKVKIDGKSVVSTEHGVFQVYIKKDTQPQTVTATKDGLLVKEWKYDAQKHTISIIMQSQKNLLRGELLNKFNDAVESAYVSIKGINDGKPSKTDYYGKFAIALPDGYKANVQTPFFVDGLPVDSKTISFKDDFMFVILRKPQAPKEVKEESSEPKKEEKITQTVTNDTKNKEKNSKQKNQTQDWDYEKAVKQLFSDIENQRVMISESGEKVREDLSRITEKVKIKGSSADRTAIRNEMISLEMQLSENNKVYNESQQKTNEVIEKLKMELIERDSLNSLTQEKLEEVTEEKREVEERFQRDILIASALIIFLLTLAIVFYFVGKRIKKQNHQISLQSQELTHAYQEIKVKNGTLETQKSVLENQKSVLESQKVIIEKKNLNITASINYAQRIQRAMLPRPQDIQSFLPESFLLFKPKEIVSGDFYWIAEQEDEYGAKKVIIAAIDCTGHGVPGAFMSMVGDGLLNQIVKLQEITSPELILKELDKGIRDSLNQEETENKDGMDIAICVIDKTNRKLEFAGAKNPLIYIQGGELNEIVGDKLHIGGYQAKREKENFQKKNFTKHTIDTYQTTTCYIFSDGYEDQFGGEENKKFSKRQLYKVLLENHKASLPEQRVILEDTMTKWLGSNSQIDDILVIGFQI